MTEATASELNERVLGRRWTVRLDAAGRGSAAVRISCSRPSCAEQRLPSAAAGRAAAVAHLKTHLRAAPGPRAEVYCACRAESCRTHLRPDDRQMRAQPWRCGGAVVWAVVTDREGRWWQALECCSRCAAATPGAKVVITAQPASGPAAGTPDTADRPSTAPAGAPQFSDRPPPTARPRDVPAPRSAPVRRHYPYGRIAQRAIPHDLRPVVLRDELVELGQLFRTYQQRAEPDLALLADLQERKARAFTTWADVTCDVNLRLEARRAEQAAIATRLQHQQRTGCGTDGDGPAVTRLLTAATQWEHARSVLAYVADHSPLPGPEARLLVVMLTLRTAHAGTGNLVGQDVTALGLTDPEDLVEKMTDCGWLSIPGTAGDLLASRPENPTPVTVPSLVAREDGTGPFTFGKKMRPKLSGWAQKVVSDKKLRKAKTTAGTRLLALTLATQTSASGRLGPGGTGVALDSLATLCPVDPGELQHLVDQLTATDWLTEAAVTDTDLTGQLTERVLPLTCPLP
ncbi:hypothetical protein [Streptomyces sp. Ncost-T10-10d]|uniref:hypothetical protein n=1 Tax=Streptomyces sp. Ncost-T10-10d TaxID=1839774 RepID=UPI00081D5BEB|nr:hypothetical protein [Streptomyces sp. Ncost-T10-10d]SCF90545.1 hypothetical protein GA0115254_12403 [Streptomyces sp. Ncost-T10-10d]